MKRLSLIGLIIIVLALPVAPIQAQEDSPVAPPPAEYGNVVEAYTAFEESTVTQGAEMVEWFLTGEFETLYSRFTPDLQAIVTQEQIESTLAQLTAESPVGERVAYRVLSSGESRIYVAQHAWGESSLTFIGAFDAQDQIEGLNIQPVEPLPDDPAADYASAATFRLPFDGLWYTFWGGPDALHNYHVSAAPQRHAYDFVIWKDGGTFSGDGTQVTDYYAYGQPVLTPVDGTVVTVVDGLPEVQPQVETDAENPAGNHVVIQVAEGEYLFLAHMQPGSILVAEGDTVQAGQPLGLTGNSGNTSEPHLHIHMQDTPDLFATDDTGQITGLGDAIGLPLPFSAIVIDGEAVDAGVPLGGQFVQNQSQP